MAARVDGTGLVLPVLSFGTMGEQLPTFSVFSMLIVRWTKQIPDYQL